MKSVTVFCGSAPGRLPEYREAAVELGRLLAARGITLVYGGSNIGLMGALADACLDAGGHVIGVIPQGLVEKEVAHRGITDLRIVTSMHERKAVMADLADAFIALPGGFGTFDEFFEILTWAQLGIHRKPFALLNTAGYYTKLLEFLDHASEEGFVRPQHRTIVHASPTPTELLDSLSTAPLASLDKWITKSEI